MLLSKSKELLSNTKARKFLIYGFGQAFNLLTPLLIIPYIVYVCGEAGLGKIGISLSLMFILIVIVDYGSYIKGVREVAINRDDKPRLQEIFSNVYALKFLLLAATTIVITVAILTLPYFQKEKSVFLFSIFVIIGQFVNPGWFLQGVENFKWITITNIISKVLYLGGVLVFVKNEADYIYVNLLLGLGAIIGNGVGLIWLMKHYGFTFAFDKKGVTEIFVGDFNFCVSQLCLSLRQYAPIIIIGALGGDFVAGQYKIIEQVIMLFRTYLQMFFRFIYGSVCYEIDNNIHKGIRLWKKANALNFLFILVLLTGLLVMSKEVLQFFKVDAAHLDYMSTLLRFSLLIPVLFAISNPLEQLLFAFDKNRQYINITIGLTFLNIALVFIPINGSQLYGAISAIAFTELIIIFAYYYCVKSNINPVRK